MTIKSIANSIETIYSPVTPVDQKDLECSKTANIGVILPLGILEKATDPNVLF